MASVRAQSVRKTEGRSRSPPRKGISRHVAATRCRAVREIAASPRQYRAAPPKAERTARPPGAELGSEARRAGGGRGVRSRGAARVAPSRERSGGTRSMSRARAQTPRPRREGMRSPADVWRHQRWVAGRSVTRACSDGDHLSVRAANLEHDSACCRLSSTTAESWCLGHDEQHWHRAGFVREAIEREANSHQISRR